MRLATKNQNIGTWSGNCCTYLKKKAKKLVSKFLLEERKKIIISSGEVARVSPVSHGSYLFLGKIVVIFKNAR